MKKSEAQSPSLEEKKKEIIIGCQVEITSTACMH